MPTIAKEGGGDFHAVPVGNYQAVCYGVWDIGIQKGEWKGKPKVAHQVVLGFEVNKRIQSQDSQDGKRYTILKFYTLFLGTQAGLRKDLTSWRGKEFTKEELAGFDVDKLIGANCFLNIVLNKNNRPKIASIAAVPEGVPPITAETSPAIPDYVAQKKAQAITPEQAKAIRALAAADESEAVTDNEGDEIPF